MNPQQNVISATDRPISVSIIQDIVASDRFPTQASTTSTTIHLIIFVLARQWNIVIKICTEIERVDRLWPTADYLGLGSHDRFARIWVGIEAIDRSTNIETDSSPQDQTRGALNIPRQCPVLTQRKVAIFMEKMLRSRKRPQCPQRSSTW